MAPAHCATKLNGYQQETADAMRLAVRRRARGRDRTAQRGDRRLNTGAALVFTIKDGKAQDLHGVEEDLDDWDEFWS